MLNRRRFLLLALVLLLTATFFLPPVYWRVVGWVNGEAFYDGRPTSWWSAELQKWTVGNPPSGIADSWIRHPSNSEVLWAKISGNNDVFLFNGLPDFDRNPAAVPLLIELLRDPNRNTRYIAVSALGEMGPAAKPSFAALLEYRNSLGDGDSDRMEVEHALYNIDSNAAAAAGITLPR